MEAVPESCVNPDEMNSPTHLQELNDMKPETPCNLGNGSSNSIEDFFTKLSPDCKNTSSTITGEKRLSVDNNDNSDLEDGSNKSSIKKKKIQIFEEYKGPYWYKVNNNLVTPCLITENLPKVYENLPIFGKPSCRADLDNFQERMIKNYVGCDLDDAEYNELKNYCSVENLKTGQEIVMNYNIPQIGKRDLTMLQKQTEEELEQTEAENEDNKLPNLFVLKKLKMRMERDPKTIYTNRLKYRGVRVIPLSEQDNELTTECDQEPPDLEPGKDLLYRVRVYRPFIAAQHHFDSNKRSRQSVFSCEVVVSGRSRLSALRDLIVCRNDLDVRLDVSRQRNAPAPANAKELFPSGFMFINNVFYVDERPGCTDTSAVVRAWARKRGKGDFPKRSMDLTVDSISIRLAHPEVYVHQGNCEHLFVFSEARLAGAGDPARGLPRLATVSHTHMVYCATCAEFAAKWVVAGCARVPFDPAYFCELCFGQYLYVDDRKVGDFKAYYFRGNEINVAKTTPGQAVDL